MIFKTIFQHSHLMDEVLIGTGHHKFNITITITEQIVSLTAVIICIYYQLGIFVLIIPGFCQTAVKQGCGWIYITGHIINLRFRKIVWQSWIAASLAGIIYGFIIQGVFLMISLAIPRTIAALIAVVLGIYVLPGPGYYFWLALFGGYDSHTLMDFENAVNLAGPSKIIVRLWYSCAAFSARHSKLHGRFAMFYEHVGEEIQELQIAKDKVDTKASP
jgi:hypothetical protein